jgi:DNA helicase-2/ATP-dependent DNA helicase PcrA
MTRSHFTDEQRAVIAHDSGHAMVGAVPGSGKTTVLIARLRRLVRGNADPARILTVMFNKAAQVSFDARLRRAITSSSAVPDVRTFHSIGYSMLTKRLVEVGELKPARMITSSRALELEAKKALRQVWLQQHGKGVEMTKEHLQGFLEFITLVKAQTDTPSAVFEERNYGSLCSPYVAAFDLFEEERAERGQIYFDDLIYRPVMHMIAKPELWSLFADRFEMIMADEFQDTSPVQYEMIKGLAGTRSSVMVVGDGDQAIYGWRGSRVSLLTKEFATDFSPCAQYPMTRTFRFGNEVALFANHLIANNRDREDRLTIAAPENPDTRIEQRPLTAKAGSGIDLILAPYHAEHTLSTTALLVRNFAHGVAFELELASAGIPFHVYGRVPLIFLPEIAALVAALSIATDHWIVPDGDRFPFASALLHAPSLYLTREASDTIAEAMEADLAGPNRQKLASHLTEASQGLYTSNARLARALDDRADIVKLLASGALADKAPRVIAEAYIRMTGMREAIERNAITTEQADEAKATLEAFLQIAERSGTAVEFLDMLGPLAAHRQDKPPQEDHASIMTAHRAKGLEFSLVMVAGLARGIFPDVRPESELEEERRIAFVIVTRAIDRLILFHPEDTNLAAMVKDPAFVPVGDPQTQASPYVYEGDLGLVYAISEAIRSGEGGSINARSSDVAARYLDQIGRRDIQIVVSEAARKFQSSKPLPRNFVPDTGEILWNELEGPCEVVRSVLHPVYLMRRARDDGSFHAVIDSSGAWQFAASHL